MMPRVNKKEEAQRLRIRIIEFLFLAFVGAILLRASDLQLKSNPKLGMWAKKEYEKFVVLAPERGEIFDRNGRPLASSIAVKSIYANPQMIRNETAASKKLSKILGIPEAAILKKLKSEKHFVWLKRMVNPDIYKRVENLSIEGVGALDESKRFYPNLELASGVIGFTGIDSKGLGGVELKFDEYLRSEESKYTGLKDALGRTLFTDGFFVKEYSKGKNIFLTIDRTIQYIAENELDREMKKGEALRGYVIVMEPATGNILAMVSRPKFNPNDIGDTSLESLTNGTVSLAYEPGSTMKVFVIASAIEEGLVKPDDLFYCMQGSFSVAGKSIKDSTDRSWMNPASVIKYSSNIGAAKIALLLGRQKLYNWMKAFGFGEPTGIELPGETAGLLRPFSRWSSLDIATIGFGQGIAVSPLQLITALSTLANGGSRVKPHIVSKVVDSEGRVILENDPVAGEKIISRTTVNTIRNYMIGVTDEDGTGSKAGIDGFSVAGKTGTAQKVDPATGEYSFEKTIASFMGFTPADNPRIAVLVVLDEPKGISFGGQIAAPVFKRIVEQTLDYMKILPPKDMDLKIAEQMNFHDGDEEQDQEIILASAGEDTLRADDRIIPDFEGLSIREALRIAQKMKIEVSINGSGMAFRQAPRAGAKLTGRTQVMIYFRPI